MDNKSGDEMQNNIIRIPTVKTNMSSWTANEFCREQIRIFL